MALVRLRVNYIMTLSTSTCLALWRKRLAASRSLLFTNILYAFRLITLNMLYQPSYQK